MDFAGPPFYDPPLGGYTYQSPPSPLASTWSLFQPNFASASPFLYSPLDVLSVPSGCAAGPIGGPCDTPISDGNTLNFFDSPKDPCIFGGWAAFTVFCDYTTPLNPAFMQFTTQLVGICGSAPSMGCTSPGTPSAPLYQWSWESNFNGISPGGLGGISCQLPLLASCGAESVSWASPIPSSGTGGITITSINGVPQMPPTASCAATPNTLWPPNGKAVSVTVSGTITPGTSSLVPGGTTYLVIDEYGQDQPSGQITLGSGGSYVSQVSLIAARNGNDAEGRTYTVIVNARDTVGNVGSCSAVVTVPHDEGH